MILQVQSEAEIICIHLVSRGMLLLSTQLLWSCAWSVLELVSPPWLPWLV